ncbi:type II toxin-antitoxin system Phd/YefM family antitoxin [Halomonas sp. TRM85114]|uniref:type II toxin-antitoxin system Phd/YefM family antitoxin n=1 Tax=Halomonas jincaotanensis TaxID=2810616 RepID=UPI001BD5EB63|nr:type II toxin-antitoxin system Phd/YefM family antitoxin [Halomonas jincaotanensis]MBS9405374.1 type II toxin-antitoxin system Phd/YefM family antitoxin [Halomonas jincaotanensis]
MTITTIPSQDLTRVMNACRNGPVFITDQGKPTHVLLSIEEYQNLTRRRSIADSLAMPDIADFAFEPPRVSIKSHPTDLT